LTQTVVKQDPRRKRKPGDKANGNGVDPGMDPVKYDFTGMRRIMMIKMIVAHEVLSIFSPDLGAATRPQVVSWNQPCVRL
jgi:hypothetical protein